MNIVILALLITVLSVLKGNCSSCLESHELETQCSGYCYDVVKPLLHHTRVCYEQSEEKLAEEDREERFKQHLDSLQELVDKNNAFTLKFLANLEINMKEKIDNALQKQNQKINSVMEDMDKKLLNLGKTFETALHNRPEFTKKLESLNKKIDNNLNVQRDQYRLKAFPLSFEKIGSKYYHISRDKAVNWQSAFAICKELGANLVTFESEDEFVAVTRHIGTDKAYWTSLNMSKDGSFVSISSGKAAPYLNWHSGEPTHTWKNASENCVLVEYRTIEMNFKMNDRNCLFLANYICEAEQ